ncbi:MAG TPA: endo-1,4-beta-xylanase, partial [Bacteroidales bacterium]
MMSNRIFTAMIEKFVFTSFWPIRQKEITNDVGKKVHLTLLIASVALVTGVVFSSNLNAQIAYGKCKFLGNIISSSVPASFTTYWNQVTPENSGKWGSVESTQGVMNWSGLDLAYNTAKNNNFVFKQHNFVWGQQQPSWITSLSAADQAAAVENWIKSYGARYPNTDLIDVVNEPLHAVPPYSDALGGAGTTGYDCIVWAFQKARQYCPNAKLLINDYGILNSDANTDQYIAIINVLKSKNLIDGIGEQGHGFETTPIATLTNNLNKLAALGLPIYISEYDVDLSDDNQQLAVYQQQFPLFWTNSAVKGITLWGYQQGAIWKTNAYLVDAYGNERSALTWLKSYVPTTNVGTCYPTATQNLV